MQRFQIQQIQSGLVRRASSGSTSFARAFALGAVVVVSTFGVVACGGVETVPCVVPQTSALATTALVGEWDVSDHEGNIQGSMSFAPGVVTSVSNGVTFHGTWELVPSDDNAYLLRLLIGGASEGGLTEEYGELQLLELTLTFGRPDLAFAMQHNNGLWSRWERRTP